MKLERRQLIHAGLFGAGLIGLRSLATGLPRNLLTDPLGTSLAQAQDAANQRILILSASQAGDPINGNVPGTYGPGREQLVHPPSPDMAETPLRLAGTETSAAKPWADLPQDVLDRTAFIHHSTYTNSHPNHPKVMRLMGNTQRSEMLVSLLAKELGASLQTTQIEPLSLGARNGGELLSFEGRTLSNVAPTALKQVLGAPDGALGDLQDLRDRDIDSIYSIFRDHGTQNQRRMLDRFAQSRDEARNISEALLGRLEAVEGNGPEDQVQAAPILAAMKVSPVISLRIPFGGDNHNDTGLEKETEQTIAGVGHLLTLLRNVEGLKTEGVLGTDVLLASINVFGRTMNIDRKGTNGRDHNSRHHCTVLIGDAIRGGVVGGVEPVGRDFGATGFDSATGASTNDGDVPYDEAFQSVAKTIGVALGVSPAYLDENILGGRPISAILAS